MLHYHCLNIQHLHRGWIGTKPNNIALHPRRNERKTILTISKIIQGGLCDSLTLQLLQGEIMHSTLQGYMCVCLLMPKKKICKRIRQSKKFADGQMILVQKCRLTCINSQFKIKHSTAILLHHSEKTCYNRNVCICVRIEYTLTVPNLLEANNRCVSRLALKWYYQFQCSAKMKTTKNTLICLRSVNLKLEETSLRGSSPEDLQSTMKRLQLNIYKY